MRSERQESPRGAPVRHRNGIDKDAVGAELHPQERTGTGCPGRVSEGQEAAWPGGGRQNGAGPGGPGEGWQEGREAGGGCRRWQAEQGLEASC